MAKVLVIGSGGREHALGWSIAQDPKVDEVLYAPGNAGTGKDEKCRNVDINVAKKENVDRLYDLVMNEKVYMVVVGPEQPLVDGIVDIFNQRGFYRIFGPRSVAAEIESDKFLSHDLMANSGIPQARSICCSTTSEALNAIHQMSTSKGVVIKARGLTAGKGVYVCGSKEEALSKLEDHAKLYGPNVLVAERLFGQEFSVFGISDGERVIPLEMSVQDHKCLLDNDLGPNTGGMGAYGPAPIADKGVVRYVADTMMTPLVRKMKGEGREYKGFLYAAVIMTEDGLKILEYNCRFGDPEAQPSVMMFKGGIYPAISAALDGKLDEVNVEFNPGASCCVVMASNGYPGKYETGLPIGCLEEVSGLSDVKVFHAGTGIKDGQIVTTGGRVLGVTVYSADGIRDARSRAYKAVHFIDDTTTRLNNKIVFIYRKDIANKAL
ncbi:MAG: phosphoribosylamine--glycine ligase [Candidatus Woesearchaeota archaeon]|nr:phosphoribosylamine--glycine ligase [Candidatus Woesearchaeota archaeon]